MFRPIQPGRVLQLAEVCKYERCKQRVLCAGLKRALLPPSLLSHHKCTLLCNEHKEIGSRHGAGAAQVLKVCKCPLFGQLSCDAPILC